MLNTLDIFSLKHPAVSPNSFQRSQTEPDRLQEKWSQNLSKANTSTHPPLHLANFSDSLHREVSVPSKQVDCLQRSESLLGLAAPAQWLTLASLQSGPGAKQIPGSVLFFFPEFPCTETEEGKENSWQDASPGAGARWLPSTW